MLTVDEILELGEEAAKKLGYKSLTEYIKVNGMCSEEKKETDE